MAASRAAPLRLTGTGHPDIAAGGEAWASSGRSVSRPLLISGNRARTSPQRAAAKTAIAWRYTSSPSPDFPCRAVETRS